jgi:hypothetical protein
MSSKYYDLPARQYTIVDASGEHLGYGRTEDANVALRDAESLNAGTLALEAVASGDSDFYRAPFRAVRVLNERGRTGQL